jgi:hypothetical protein
MRIAATVVLVVVISAAVGVLVARSMTGPTTTTTTTPSAAPAAGAPALRAPAGATLAVAAPALRPEVPAAPSDPFVAARRVATSMWRGEINIALASCLPPPGVGSVPVGVTFDLTLNEPISNEFLKRYVVERVSPPPGLAPNIEVCLRRAVGTTVNVAAAGLEVPAEQRSLREVVVFPLPAAG